jgi:beta-lactamase class A
MLEIMKHARSRSRLAKNLPPEWQFARKTGLLRHNCHDVGIVFTPDGGAYVLCVLTSQNNNYKLAKSLISSVGRMTFEFIGQPS